jgi:hypothetical protein
MSRHFGHAEPHSLTRFDQRFGNLYAVGIDRVLRAELTASRPI